MALRGKFSTRRRLGLILKTSRKGWLDERRPGAGGRGSPRPGSAARLPSASLAGWSARRLFPLAQRHFLRRHVIFDVATPFLFQTSLLVYCNRVQLFDTLWGNSIIKKVIIEKNYSLIITCIISLLNYSKVFNCNYISLGSNILQIQTCTDYYFYLNSKYNLYV